MAARKRPRSGRKPNYAKSKKPRQPLWNPLAGITQTGLEKFLGCPETFAVDYVDGMTPKKFREPLEFGNLFHLCCEFQGKDTPQNIVRTCCNAYVKSRKITAGPDHDKLQRMIGVLQVLFPLYVAKYAADDRSIRWISREKPFRVPYSFTDYDGSTQTIDLVGKRDGVYRDVQARSCLFETKTKSEINAEAIRDGLRADFQTLFYLLALSLETGKAPYQVLYNVVRRPGQKFGKSDSMQSFLSRVEKDIKTRSRHYFARWRVTLSPGTIDTFRQITLDPALRRLFQWWRSIERLPFDRFTSPYHLLNLPALTGSKFGRNEFYELIIRRNRTPYYNRSTVFPELNALAKAA